MNRQPRDIDLVGRSRRCGPQTGTTATGSDPAVHKSAIQGDRADDRQDGDANEPALDSNGLPSNPVAIAQVRIGANVDDSEVANASETGQTTNAPRDEMRPLR